MNNSKAGTTRSSRYAWFVVALLTLAYGVSLLDRWKNEFSKQSSPFLYDADYRPDLPNELKEIAKPYPRPARW